MAAIRAHIDCPCPKSCPCGQAFDEVTQTDQTWSFAQQNIQVLAGAQLLDSLFMAAIYGCNLWLQFMAAIYGCNLWLQFMAAIYGCYLWLQFMAAIYGCYLTLLFITAIYGCYLWLQFLTAIYGCYLWLQFMAATSTENFSFFWRHSHLVRSPHMGITPGVYVTNSFLKSPMIRMEIYSLILPTDSGNTSS
eukprot:sb/3471124/